MLLALGMVGITVILVAVPLAAKRIGELDERKRSDELVRMAKEFWPDEAELDALFRLYDLAVRQMYRLKHEGKPSDKLVRDVNLILSLRNRLTEDDVISELDASDARALSNEPSTEDCNP